MHSTYVQSWMRFQVCGNQVNSIPLVNYRAESHKTGFDHRAMPYEVACHCGAVHEVELWHAGTKRECRCGESVTIPSSVALRKRAGESDTPLSLPQQIQKASESGKLFGTECLSCDEETADSLKLSLVYEHAYVDNAHFSQKVMMYILNCLLVLIMAPLGFLIFMRGNTNERPEYRGRTSLISLDVPMCTHCRESLRPRFWNSGRIVAVLLIVVAAILCYLNQFGIGILLVMIGLGILLVWRGRTREQRIAQLLREFKPCQRLWYEYPSTIIRIS